MKNTIMLANLIMTMVKLSRAQRRSQVYCMACQCWAAAATNDVMGPVTATTTTTTTHQTTANHKQPAAHSTRTKMRRQAVLAAQKRLQAMRELRDTAVLTYGQ